jgi:hypothetical protein
MNKQRLHIRVLILFQLLIFIGPYAIKYAHHHTNVVKNTFQTSFGLGKTDETCPICKFEFVTSITGVLGQFFLFQPITPYNHPVLATQVFNEAIIYFSLRAPPLG